MRFVALAVLMLLSACATAPVIDAPSALNGRELDTALNLYGRWDQRVTLEGRPHYIWRRAVILNDNTYYCELRAEIGFRNTIQRSIVEGYPAACSLFSVQYTSNPDRRALPAANPSSIIQASDCRNCRPVGSSQQTASASDLGQAAAARPR